MVFEGKLNSTKMLQGEGVTWYLARLSQVKDELATVSVTISDTDMVRISLKGFTPEWKPFIKGIVSRDKLLDWNRLWDEFIQEELTDEHPHLMKREDDDMVLTAQMKGK